MAAHQFIAKVQDMQASLCSGLVLRLFAAAFVFLAGCAAPELLKDAQSLESSAPVAEARDERIFVSIDTVIFRNGIGAWASDAEWDEYLIRIRAYTDEPVEIREVAIFDALDHRISVRSDRSALVDGTREVERRYVQSGKLLKSRDGSGWAVAGADPISSVDFPAYSLPPALVIGAAIAATVVIIAATGRPTGFPRPDITYLENNARVNAEIKRRQTALPLALNRGADATLDLFFPITPLAGRTQVVYADRHGEHRLDIDTREAFVELNPLPAIRTDPGFPEHARRAGAIRGYVSARLTLDREGRVQHVEVIESIPWRLFDEDARRTFLEWTYPKSRFDKRIVEARVEFRR